MIKGITCDCIKNFWDKDNCPFYLECIWDLGYYGYTQLVWSSSGQLVGYRLVLARHGEPI